ncbi:transcriptional regulator [Alicyclobacillus acidoterrestris]|nr:transcriptional regulator [Alicyclobacillus acidoterrestris]
MENRIKELRKAKKLSQEEVAKLCGVSRQTIHAIENNKYDPTLLLAFKLAKHLDTTVNELFKDGEHSKVPSTK